MQRPLTSYDPSTEHRELSQRAQGLYPEITASLIKAFAALPVGNAKVEVGKSHTILSRPTHEQPWQRLETTHRFLTAQVFSDQNLTPQERAVLGDLLDTICTLTGLTPLHRVLECLWRLAESLEDSDLPSSGLQAKFDKTSSMIQGVLARKTPHQGVVDFLTTAVTYYQERYNLEAKYHRPYLMPYIYELLQLLYTMVPLTRDEGGEGAWEQAERADTQAAYEGDSENEEEKVLPIHPSIPIVVQVANLLLGAEGEATVKERPTWSNFADQFMIEYGREAACLDEHNDIHNETMGDFFIVAALLARYDRYFCHPQDVVVSRLRVEFARLSHAAWPATRVN